MQIVREDFEKPWYRNYKNHDESPCMYHHTAEAKNLHDPNLNHNSM